MALAEHWAVVPSDLIKSMPKDFRLKSLLSDGRRPLHIDVVTGRFSNKESIAARTIRVSN